MLDMMATLLCHILKNNSEIVIEKQLDFQDFFSTIDKETVDNFTTIFQKTRQQFRGENPNAWFVFWNRSGI
ncbi:MAG: hypothetical protein Rpha_1319 [Candidatus Ruthia sp. Apha_13_S6]|nr:hypothetical protein [Candidatus Ruthia sp. Apha_13_S6]